MSAPEFFIDDDGAFSGSTALCVSDPQGGLRVVVQKCEVYDETWDLIVAAVGSGS